MGRRAGKWTKETIVDAIRRCHSAGADLSFSRVRHREPRLVGAAVRHFGGWRQAVEAAGVDYGVVRGMGKEHRRRRVTKWTPESIRWEMRRLWASGKDIRASAVSTRLPGLYNAARQCCGSWAAALLAAGIPPHAAEAAAVAHRNWKARWLKRLKAQASDAKVNRARGKRDYRQAFAAARTLLAPDWLHRLTVERGK